MRTVLQGTSELRGIAGTEWDVLELLRHAPDWEQVDEPGFSAEDLKARFEELLQIASRRKRGLPTRFDDPLIAEVIDRPEYQARPDLPLAASNALVILAQIPEDERGYAEAARWIWVFVHH